MNNVEKYHVGDPDNDVGPPNQQEQEADGSPYTSCKVGETSMASVGESFILESNKANDSQDYQRSSTPTEMLTHFAEEEQFSTQEVVLSPVLKPVTEDTTPDDDQDKLSHKQLFLSSEGYSIQDNSGEESQSLYSSALSNVNGETLGGYSEGKQRLAVSSPSEVSVLQDTLCNESLGESSSTQDATWATACGSLQDSSNVKDVTIRQEFAQSNLWSNWKDSNHEHNSELTYEDMASIVEDDQESHNFQNIDLHNGMNSDKTVPVEENSPDLELLNEICEEATNMTIKEALICSLNPGVRAGLREGRLSLNESEILALEQYCEHFIDNLMSQLLDGHWSEEIYEVASKPQQREDKAKMAKKLSSLGLETLKSNCDRFVHSIITESLHDSCFGFQNIDDKSLSDRALSGKQRKNDSLDENSVQILLPLFKESQAIQDYIGFLAADVIKSALANLSTSIVTTNGEKNDHMTLNKNSSSDHKANTERKLCFSEHKEGTVVSLPNDDMLESQSDASLRGLENDETERHKALIRSDDDFEGQYARETEGLSDDEQMLSSSLNGALETSLEFDAGDWEGGGFLEDLHLPDTEHKQKIVLRELSFDEHADVAGTELLAPVFLAIAEENDDDTEIQGMRKKALSIEDLCGVIDELDDKSRERSYSAPKRIVPVCQTAESDFLPEGESDEKQSSDEEYEEDDKSEISDEEAGDDKETQDGQGQEKSAESNGSSDPGERFRWHTVSVNGREKILDLKLLEPYMKVISHGGYFSDTKATIVVIAACYLPDRSLTNYDFLMEQLFFYVISTLELLAIHEDYYLVYLNGGARQQNMPSVSWMKRFYQYIEGGLKKRMREMLIVHPTFRLKAVVTLAKPFLNSTFWRKLSFVHTLGGLSSHIPVDYIYIPDEVMRMDPDFRQVHNR